MLFVLGKLAWMAIDPANVIIELLCIGLVLYRLWPRVGFFLIRAGTVLLIVAGLLPTGAWLLRTLEERFPAHPDFPDRPTGILVLGGAIDQMISAGRDSVAMPEA